MYIKISTYFDLKKSIKNQNIEGIELTLQAAATRQNSALNKLEHFH